MKKKVYAVLALLDRHYGSDIKCFLDHENAWQLLAATILSAQCTDARVNIVTRELFARYKSVNELAEADQKELEDIIRTTGFFRTKAKNIIACCSLIRDYYSSEVPESIEELTALPGVGRKTANVIRGNIFNDPSIAVDTHVKRVSNRLGFTDENDPVKIEYDLMKVLPKESWIQYNKQIITHGRAICKAPSPKCEICFLKEYCRYYKSKYKHASKSKAIATKIPALIESKKAITKVSRVGQDGLFLNPFIWADIPDPDVIRVNNTYYMISTTMYFCPGIPVMKSYDLVRWEIVNYVYDILDDSDLSALRNGADSYGKGSWAGSLRYHNEMFYVAVASFSTNKTYIFQTEDIENGTWRRYVLDRVFHDSSLLFDDDGRVYLVYDGGTIRLIELTADAIALLPGGIDQVIIEKADIGGAGGLPAEGSHIYKIGSMYYLFLIAWPKTGSGQRIELCYRASHIEGPYEGRVVLDDDMRYNRMGVAQGGIVDTPDGDWYAMLFQDHGAVGRIPVLVPVTWKDDWPIFGVNKRVPSKMALPNSSYINENINENIIISDEFSPPLKLAWQWNHNPDNEFWSLTERPGYLRLKTGHLNHYLLDAHNTLTQRTIGPECIGITAIDISKMNDGDVAGLAALQELYGYVGVKMENGKKHVIMINASSGQAVETESIHLHKDRLYLRLDFDFNDNDKAKFYYSLDEVEWHTIGDSLFMQYKLSHFTGYRFALFNYSTQIIGGFVDFDYFRIYHPA